MNSLDIVFAALADPTRREILSRLANGDASVTDLVKPFRISQPAISRHLRVLEEASLITRSRRGKHRMCRLNARAMATAYDWIGHYRSFWNSAFDRLDAHLKHKAGGSRSA